MNPFRPSILRTFALALATSCAAVLPVAAETINIGIGTQDTTTNTVTTGVVIKELKLLD